MKLRELFDKMTPAPGMLDRNVTVKLEKHYYMHPGTQPRGEKMISVSIRPLERVEIQDDGSITLVVTE